MACVVACITSAWAVDAAPAGIDFNRDIRPILSENCFKCHGPDEAARKAGLRLDIRDGALKPAESGKPALALGKAAESELIRRVASTDPSLRMPPPAMGKGLSADQIETLKRWIGEGAPYAVHWAYAKPVRPEVPQVKDSNWPRNDLDRFVLARLEKEKLKPSERATPEILARRVALDLTGLPPIPEQVERFAKDPNQEAYLKLVDELLGSPAFGEHWARLWLDLARYADSAGYADDPPRTIWYYRDYVIKALNRNVPFDRFTLEQIAGDLLPDAGEEERAASAFHRNTMTNSEGGTDDEEFRNAAVVDRVNTTMAVWMGTSMACAQCHTHKYDPISQREYFQMFAVLNNTEDADRPDESPLMRLFSDAQKAERAAIQERIKNLETLVANPPPTPARLVPEWDYAFPLEQAWDIEQCRLPLRPGADRVQLLALSPEALAAVLTPAERRGAEQVQALRIAELAAVQQNAADLQRQLKDMPQTTLPIMSELPADKRRTTAVHLRGNFRDLGETVEPGIPEVFHPLPEGAKPDRIGLAKWLVDSENPLTSRVLANRLWEQLFGVGIVRTTEEFGSQGEPPNYPELLDYLATEIVARGWDLKDFLRYMVSSAAYQQSSVVTRELLERDPENILLARGPRYRMTAEVIRDQALYVSGLLSRKMYGPPVRPPQPSLGLSAAFGGGLDWKTSEGEDKYRRALYTEWRRTNPYASLATFDAPNREVCTLRRSRSNTPLQALVTLNDPVFFEAAQALARRMHAQAGAAAQKAEFGFRTCLYRAPKVNELERLLSLFESSRSAFAAQPESAAKVVGQTKSDPEQAAELAAWTVVANVLLNLDELLMRP